MSVKIYKFYICICIYKFCNSVSVMSINFFKSPFSAHTYISKLCVIYVKHEHACMQMFICF